MNRQELYLGVPLGVIRKFVEMNKDQPDNWVQMFEIRPEFIHTRTELEQYECQERGAVVVDLESMFGGKNEVN